MHQLSLPIPVALFLRRVLTVFSSLTVSNQYLLIKRAEAVEARKDTGHSSPSSNGTLRSLFEGLNDLRASTHRPEIFSGVVARIVHQRSLGQAWVMSQLQRLTDEPPSLVPKHHSLLKEKECFTVQSTADAHDLDGESYDAPASPDDHTNGFIPSLRRPSPSSDQSEGGRPYIDDRNTPQSVIQQLYQSPVLFDPVRRPRYPIVLCHGLYGFDVRGPSSFPSLQVHYWSTVLDILRKKVGAEVIVAGVPGTGSIELRAKHLNESLQRRARGRAVNILAHSMGGLDGRYLITHCQPETYAPISLTTVCTPHRGSPFMDWCSQTLGLGRVGRGATTEESSSAASADPSKGSTSTTLSGVQSTLSNLPSSVTTLVLGLFDSPAYANLTTDYLNDVFNPATPDDPNVKYYSVATRTKSISIWHPLCFPKAVLDRSEEEARQRLQGYAADFNSEVDHDPNEWGNDGLVTIRSAKWGEFLGTIDNCDHWEVRGARGLSRLDIANAWSKDRDRKGSKELTQKDVDKATEVLKEMQNSKNSKVWSNEKDEVVKSSTDKVSAIFDWLVDQVPLGPLSLKTGKASMSLSPSLSSEGLSIQRSKPSPPRSESPVAMEKFDLERFYVALSRKLYDDGL